MSGGIHNPGGGTVTVQNSTLSGNMAIVSGGGIYNGHRLNLTNALIAGNTKGAAPMSSGSDIGGARGVNFATSYNNLIGDGTGMVAGISNGDAHGNQVGGVFTPIDPLLGPLQDNGGFLTGAPGSQSPIQTMALQVGSPAQEAGNASFLPAGTTTDQRGPGFGRVAGTLDIGAYEISSSALGGRAWNDLNSDGIQDAGEPDLQYVGVEVFEGVVSQRTTITDAAGRYRFTDLAPGVSYTVVFHPIVSNPPPAFTFAPPNAGGNDALDSDVNATTGQTAVIVLAFEEFKNDVDAGLLGTVPAFGWALQAGGGGIEEGNAIATDAAGNVYVTGRFQGTADFDPGAGTVNLTSAGGDDVFVAKYTAAGALVWARRLGGTGTDRGTGVAVDGSGNIYTSGFFSGTVDFDPGTGNLNLTSAGGEDGFLSKLDAAGNFVWARQFDDNGAGVAVDGGGNAYTIGSFVRKLDSGGNVVWARSLDGSGFRVVVDGSGNVYTTGFFQHTANFGAFNLTSAGFTDVFVSKLDAAGNFVWAKQLGGAGQDEGYGVAVDGSGNVYTTGAFEGMADFDPGTGTFDLTSAGSFDGFVSKLDAAGNFVWAKQVGGTNIDQGRGVAVDGSGNIYTTGFFLGTADFDPGAGIADLTRAGLLDVFVSKLDAAGNFVSARRFGGGNTDVGFGVAVDGGGSVYTTGLFQGPVDFDPGTGNFDLTSAGVRDVFVSKWLPDITPPSVTINQGAAQADPTNASPIVFGVVFTEPVTDFDDAADISFAGSTAPGTLTAIITQSGPMDGTTYTVSVSGMTGSGRVVASVVAGAAVNSGGNVSLASTTTDNSVTFDNAAPTVTIDQAAGQADPTNAQPIHFTVVFSEAISAGTFTGADVTLTGTAGGLAGATRIVTLVSGNTYDVAVSGLTGDGTVIASIGAGTVQDLAGNTNTASTSSDNTVTLDTTAPTVTINQAAGQADPTNAQPIHFTVVFSEAISPGTFTGADVTLTGTAGGLAGATRNVTLVSGNTYNVAVSGLTGDGTVIASIGAGTVQDLAGNTNTASTSSDNTVTLDITAPTVTINQAAGQADPTNANSVQFTVTFSEVVTGFGSADVNLSASTAPGALTAAVSGSGTTYTVLVSGMTGSGTAVASVHAGAAVDGVGNASLASTSTDNTVTFIATFYVDDSFSGTSGDPIADADLGTTGNQPAVLGSTAFTTVAAAQAAGGPLARIVVNSGSYAEAVNLAGAQMLRITGPDAPGAVTIKSLAGAAGTSVQLLGSSSLTVGDGTSTTFAGVLSGTGRLIKTGSGTLALVAANTYTGGTTISQGRLRLDHATAAGTGTITLGDTNSAGVAQTLAGNVASESFLNPMFLSNPIVVSGSGTGTATIRGDQEFLSFSGLITLNRATTLAGSVGDRYGFSGKITGNVGTLTIDPDTRITFDQTEENANNFVGNVVINADKTLQLNTPFGLNASHAVTANGLLRVLGGAPDSTPTILTIGTLTGNGFVNGDTGGGHYTKTLEIGGDNGTGTFSGSIFDGQGGDVLNITKIGAGTQTLSGYSGFVGLTTVSAGTLLVNDMLEASPVTVADGATLGGSGGTVTGSVTVSGSLAPGNGGTTTGLLTLGSLSFPDAAAVDINLNGTTAGTGYDQLIIDPFSFFPFFGSASLTNATLNVTVGAGFTPSVGTTFTILTSAGEFTGTFTNGATVSTADGYEFSIDYTGSEVVLTVTDARPTVTINQAAGQSDPTNTGPILFTVVFSEAVTGFTAADVSFAGSTATGMVAAVTALSTTTYIVNVTGMTGSGTVVASVVAGAALDGGGKASRASTSTDNSVTYDAPPTVTINQAAGQADPTNASSVQFTVIFSEAVSDFDDAADIDLSGSTAPGSLSVSITPIDAMTYTVSVSGMTGSGSVVASVVAGAALDSADNGSLASTSTDNTVTVNHAPLAQDASLTTDEDSAATETLIAADDGNPLIYTLVDTTNAHGTVVVTDASTGTYRYTPDANFHGTASFTFKASDGSADSNVATISITVNAVNDAPVVQAGSLTTDQGTTTAGTLVATDLDSTALTFSLVDTTEAHGTVTVTDASTGAYSYTPDAGYHGPASFTFKASDGSADSNFATVTITVNPDNSAPTLAIPIANQTATAGQLFGFVLPSGTFADVDAGDTLSYTASGLPGWLHFDPATQAVSGTPGAGDVDSLTTITVTATDTSGASASASFDVSVNPSGAGNVTVTLSNGRLTIEGDNQDNVVLVEAGSSGPNSYHISGLGGTQLIHGQTVATSLEVIGVTEKITIDLKQGGDWLFVDGRSSPLVIGPDVDIRTSQGIDHVRYRHVIALGKHTIDAGVDQGGTAERTDIILHDSSFAGSLNVKSRNGDDLIVLERVNVTGKTTLDAGVGPNTVQIVDSSFGNDLVVQSHSGDDVLNIARVVVGGNASIEAGVGKNAVTITESSFAGTFNVDSGSGDDLLNLEQLTIAGNATIQAGVGKNSVSLIGSSFAGTLRLDSGSGDDLLRIIGVSVARDATIDAGIGKNRIEVLDSVFVEKFSGTTGSGIDDFLIRRSRFEGAASIKAGAGNDQVAIFDSVFLAAVTLDGQSGTDSLNENGNTFAIAPVISSF